MVHRFYYFAGPQDHVALRDYILSLGTILLPAVFGQVRNVELDDFHVMRGCRISEQPFEGLVRPRKDSHLSDCLTMSNNAVLGWIRSYVKDDWIVAGEIEWQPKGDFNLRGLGLDPEADRSIGVIYRKIKTWVRKNWMDRDGDRFYFGPQALDLVTNHGFSSASFIPGTVALRKVYLDDTGQVVREEMVSDLAEFDDGKVDWSLAKREG
jgi:hypothetical protein